MSLLLPQLFPGIDTGLNQIGFLFGAGTSKEAGYPLMGDLTKNVISNLTDGSKSAFEDVLSQKGLVYDSALGTPNIEVISDLVIEATVATPASRYDQLEIEIRNQIAETILSIDSPDLSNHVRFLEGLKRRSHSTSSKVTIFTTNYDVLFELAAGEVGIRIETGFDGALRRSFLPSVFDHSRGKVERSRFSATSELQINLIKLHGSISWRKEGTRIIESGIGLHDASMDRTIILPRRRKVIDTLVEPFDQLFTKSARILGADCKYLVSCGFSYGDKHINDQLILPNLKAGKVRLTALFGEEPECLNELKKFPSFQAGLPDKCIICGEEVGEGTDLWTFSALSNLIQP